MLTKSHLLTRRLISTRFSLFMCRSGVFSSFLTATLFLKRQSHVNLHSPSFFSSVLEWFLMDHLGICEHHCLILYVYFGGSAEIGGVLTFYIPAIIDGDWFFSCLGQSWVASVGIRVNVITKFLVLLKHWFLQSGILQGTRIEILICLSGTACRVHQR